MRPSLPVQQLLVILVEVAVKVCDFSRFFSKFQLSQYRNAENAKCRHISNQKERERWRPFTAKNVAVSVQF